MAKSNSVATDPGEPSSYQLMEKTLSMAVANSSKKTKESEGNGLFLSKSRTDECHNALESGNKSIERSQSRLSETINQKSANFGLTSIAIASSMKSEASPGIAKESSDVTKTTSPEHETRILLQSTVPTVDGQTLGKIVKGDSSHHSTVDNILSDPPPLLSGAATVAEVSSAKEPNVGRVGPLNVVHTDILGGPAKPLAVAQSPQPVPVSSSSVASKGKSGTPLRRGKWTVEEEAYVARVIQDFNSGYLNAPAGTTLRSYLSEKLQCDPMRITKKFTGDACIGKRVFHPAVRSTSNSATIDKAQAELDALERRWRRRLEMQQRESAKKAAASAAATNSSSNGSRLHGAIQVTNPTLQTETAPCNSGAGGGHHMNQNAVSQAATWLDRANAVLKKGSFADDQDPKGISAVKSGRGLSQPLDSMPSSEIENQMKEVQRLIYEGPMIQQTTAGLPHILEQGVNGFQSRGHSASESGPMRCTSSRYSETLPASEPADKRMRTTSGTGAEDAEALVGFLRSVRASAASAQEYSG